MDVPSPVSGTVEKLLVKIGDKISEGHPVLRLRGHEEGAMTQPPSLLSQQEPPPAAQARTGNAHASIGARRCAAATRRSRGRGRHCNQQSRRYE